MTKNDRKKEYEDEMITCAERSVWNKRFSSAIAIYEELGLNERVIEVCQKELCYLMKNHSAYTGVDNERIAQIYEKLGNTEKAMEMWQKHAKRMEEKAVTRNCVVSVYESYILAAQVYEKLGNMEKATEMWQKYKKRTDSAFEQAKACKKIYELSM